MAKSLDKKEQMGLAASFHTPTMALLRIEPLRQTEDVVKLRRELVKIREEFIKSRKESRYLILFLLVYTAALIIIAFYFIINVRVALI